jgi:hypothetical protein
MDPTEAIPMSATALKHDKKAFAHIWFLVEPNSNHTHSSDAQVHAPSVPATSSHLQLCLPHTVAKSYHTVITFKPSSRLLCVLHPNLSHSCTFCACHTHNCALCISTRSLAASALFVQSQHRNSCPIHIKHILCISQHVASIQVQTDTFAFSASCHPPCYSLKFSDQGVLSLRGCIGI